MSSKPRKTHTEEHNTTWLGVMLDLLKGGIVGAATAIIVLLGASVLIWGGVLKSSSGDSIAIVACVLGALTAGLFAAGSDQSNVLLKGVGAGAVLFLILLSVGAIICDALPTAHIFGAIPIACLCGGGASALLKGRGKKKRRK